MLLSSIADGFRHNCTNADIVGRMGGDEFVFILPGMNAQSSTERLRGIAEAVIQASRSLAFDSRVSASLGASFYPADAETAEELLALADRRMYLDKQAHYDKLGPKKETTQIDRPGKAAAA
jgi:diguanylate cyclase (GGDEF)-like protein